VSDWRLSNDFGEASGYHFSIDCRAASGCGFSNDCGILIAGCGFPAAASSSRTSSPIGYDFLADPFPRGEVADGRRFFARIDGITLFGEWLRLTDFAREFD
jgi:hypothetical protein